MKVEHEDFSRTVRAHFDIDVKDVYQKIYSLLSEDFTDKVIEKAKDDLLSTLTNDNVIDQIAYKVSQNIIMDEEFMKRISKEAICLIDNQNLQESIITRLLSR